MSDRFSPVVIGDPPPGRGHHGRFAAGNRGGPGRPRGSRHRLSEALLEQLAADFAQHGPSVIERVRTEDPASYLRVIVALVPKEIGLTAADGEPVTIQVVTNVGRAPGDMETYGSAATDRQARDLRRGIPGRPQRHASCHQGRLQPRHSAPDRLREPGAAGCSGGNRRCSCGTLSPHGSHVRPGRSRTGPHQLQRPPQALHSRRQAAAPR